MAPERGAWGVAGGPKEHRLATTWIYKFLRPWTHAFANGRLPATRTAEQAAGRGWGTRRGPRGPSAQSAGHGYLDTQPLGSSLKWTNCLEHSSFLEKAGPHS